MHVSCDVVMIVLLQHETVTSFTKKLKKEVGQSDVEVRNSLDVG
jgi:hypothetical protein